MAENPKTSLLLDGDRVQGRKNKIETGATLDGTRDVTFKTLKSWHIIGSIQVGISHSLGQLKILPDRDLLMHDFMALEQVYFSSTGSDTIFANSYPDFKFRTYAPVAFRFFRDLFGIQANEFTGSVCSVPLVELQNPGASSSLFYLSHDDEFILKTVQRKEARFLQRLLPGYYLNLHQNPRTLLPKFFGLFSYTRAMKNMRFVIMNNLLPTHVKMHQKYDLKGSTYKRKASRKERKKHSPTFKDLDFLEQHQEGILLEEETHAALMKTLRRDVRVLESFEIMDYSLLVGIHNLDIAVREGRATPEVSLKTDTDTDERTLTRSRSRRGRRLVAYSTTLESIEMEIDAVDISEGAPSGGIPARNGKGERLLVFLGIIDILQSYGFRKRLEHTFKALIHDGDTVSVHRPGFYAERFMDFMTKAVFKKIPSHKSYLDLNRV